MIAHVVGAERTIENDYAVSYDLWMKYANPRLKLAPFALGPIEIKSYIAGMDFFVGARMHATIGAFSSGVPVVPMAYSRKFNGLFMDTLRYNHLVDMKSDDNRACLEMIFKSFEDRYLLKEEIVHQMNTTLMIRKNELMNDLANFLKL